MTTTRLTNEEQKTLASYQKIAAARAKIRSDPEFWRYEFEKFRSLLPAGRIIDLGCGSGRDALLFTETQNYTYIGIDLSDEMLREAKKLVPHASFEKMSLYRLKYPPQSFDGFWASASLLHIPKRNIGMVLQEIRQVLKPSGVGFITLKEGNGEKMISGSLEGDERFYAFYREEEFARLLYENQFNVISSSREIREDNTSSQNLTSWLVYFVRASKNAASD